MFETPASFAARLHHWTGGDLPLVVRLAPELPAPAPGALILSACGGHAMLFATGYPVADEETGAETYGAGELWLSRELGLIWVGEFDQLAYPAEHMDQRPLDAVIGW